MKEGGGVLRRRDLWKWRDRAREVREGKGRVEGAVKREGA